MVQLRDIIEGSGQYGTSQRSTRDPVGLPVLRMGNLRDGRITWNDLKYVALPKSEEDKYRLVFGDILFNRTNSAELVGKSAVFNGDQEAVFASYLIRFRVRRLEVEPEYLCAYINSRFGRSFITANMARAIGQANISASVMRRMPIPLPSLHEQRRVITMIEARREANSRISSACVAQVEAASALQSALLRHIFGEQWPLSLELDVPSAVTPKWPWVRLENVAQLESGHTPSRGNVKYWGGDVPWISLKDVTALDDIYIQDTADHPTMEGINNSAARMLPKGTVVLSRTASVGHSAIMARPMATSQDFANWICGPKLDPLFLLFVLRGARSVLRQAAEGAVHKTIYMPAIKRTMIMLPPREEQTAIVARLQAAWSLAKRLKETAHLSAGTLEALTARSLEACFTHMVEN